ncbi:hypothetical protein OB955_07525 [Halobacteria archaeon AArc-m2/3/4]|uniref:Uncharacterized protein n=1 Tax=Natronoglomus mannanivorans TaxID=2979990 RepID=A0AAP3E0T4_9EURY|nr:hypothetical protein [Halobacteria archaeon AArc-xg1-1]MCU4972588.1 hypothetical protein [Halobacteria archaeon AArc-m2/3/4]
MRRSLVIGAVLLVLALFFVGGPSLFTSPSTSDVAPDEQTEPEFVSFEDSDSGFWAYLNARESFEERSPINLVVRGNSEDIVRVMMESSESDWNETDHDHFDADVLMHPVQPGVDPDNESEPSGETGTGIEGETETEAASDENSSLEFLPTDIPWAQTTGATRYAHVDPGDGNESYWMTETLQIHDGDYYGQRYHIRLYESPTPEDEWVAMQAHTEHFDWFTLRHRVDGVEAAQSRAEADFMRHPQIDQTDDVRRIYLDNSGPSDSNGWATVVELAQTGAPALVAPLVVGLAAGRGSGALGRTRSTIESHLIDADRRRFAAAIDRIEAGHLILVATILALFLGVRITGVALERTVDALTMHTIAAILYPVIALGIPIATYVIAGGLERRLDAAVVASLSLATAIWLDYGLLGVDSLPIDVVFQRVLVVVALGLIAGGAARRATRESRLNDMIVVGVAMWVLVLGGTLFGYL